MPSRASDASQAARTQSDRPLIPRNRPSGAHALPNLVATTTSSRRPAMARRQGRVGERPIHVRRVEHRHSQAERLVEGGDRRVVVTRTLDVAHPHASQSLLGHAQGRSQLPLVHAPPRELVHNTCADAARSHGSESGGLTSSHWLGGPSRWNARPCASCAHRAGSAEPQRPPPPPGTALKRTRAGTRWRIPMTVSEPLSSRVRHTAPPGTPRAHIAADLIGETWETIAR